MKTAFLPGIAFAASSALLAGLPLGSARADAAPAINSPWSVSVAAGYVRTSGNSDTTALSGKAAIDYAGPDWGNVFTAGLLNSSKEKQTDAERYSIADKVTYNLTDLSYVFGAGSYDNDRFSGVTERYVLSGGVGVHALKTPTQTLDIDAGVGANRTRTRDSDSFDTKPIFVAGAKYVWKISDNAKFIQTLRTEFASNNSFINPVSELKLTVVGNLYATVDYEIRYNTDVPADTRHTDTITTFNLGYTFNPKKT